MSKTIFISRNLKPDSHLYTTLTNEGYDVNAIAMTVTTPLDFDVSVLPSIKWIFFSSKNSVETFFSKKPKIGKAHLAAIGQGTARLLEKYGTVEFIGQTNETDEVARSFARKVGDAHVLFPISDRSLKTVQKALPESQIHNLVVYSTTEHGVSIGHPDILIFTSPSNAEAFLAVNTLKDSQEVVAFGKSTGAFLQEKGVKNVHISKGTSDKAVISAIKKAIGS